MIRTERSKLPTAVGFAWTLTTGSVTVGIGAQQRYTSAASCQCSHFEPFASTLCAGHKAIWAPAEGSRAATHPRNDWSAPHLTTKSISWLFCRIVEEGSGVSVCQGLQDQASLFNTYMLVHRPSQAAGTP